MLEMERRQTCRQPLLAFCSPALQNDKTSYQVMIGVTYVKPRCFAGVLSQIQFCDGVIQGVDPDRDDDVVPACSCDPLDGCRVCMLQLNAEIRRTLDKLTLSILSGPPSSKEDIQRPDLDARTASSRHCHTTVPMTEQPRSLPICPDVHILGINHDRVPPTSIWISPTAWSPAVRQCRGFHFVWITDGCPRLSVVIPGWVGRKLGGS